VFFGSRVSLEEFMSAKIGWTAALVMAVLGVMQARAQDALPPASMPVSTGLIAPKPEIIPAPAGLNAAQPEEIPTQPQVDPTDGTQPNGVPPAGSNGDLPRRGLSDWITYNRNGCCSGPVGNHLPLMHELFLRSGVSAPLPNTIVGKNLNAGWEIEGGGRLLLFNPAGDKAWVAEAGLSTVENWHGTLFTKFPLNVIISGVRTKFGTGKVPGLSVRGLNRTFVNLGGGYEWYLLGSAVEPGRKLRVGLEGGGRFGTSKMDLTVIPHRTDTIAGVYAGGHADMEFPFAGACVLYTGVRVDWDYTWMDILQRTSDIMSINALATLGFRW
jgi:hypothetical protein